MLVPKLKRTFTIRSILISLSGFAFLISCLVLNIEATSNGFTVFTSRAFATYNENGKDNEQITYVKYSLRTILLMTPKQLKKMVENIFINENEKQIISGFSEKMSRHLIFFLNRDIFSAKKLLREMRRAKTKK